MKNKYLSRLSLKQKSWFLGVVIIALLISFLGILFEPDKHENVEIRLTVDMSIQEIAPKLKVTGKGLAKELDMPLETTKKRPLSELGISQGQLDHAVEHILSHQSTNLKYFIFTSIVLFGLFYMILLGRPENANIKERKIWYPRTPYIVCLIIAVLICGFALGKSPNPMEGAVKTFKSMVGLYPSVIDKVLVIAFFLILSIIGNKLLCGWACPFGAIQELIYSLPVLNKIKKKKIPFWLTNTIRSGLFLAMLVILFGIVGGKKGFVIYHYLNPFNLFNLDFEHWLILTSVILFIVLSLFTYRPFCHLVCPFGLISWFAERISLTRVNIDHQKCTKCGMCIRSCPTEAAQGRVSGKIFSADCFSCARCLNVCPADAIQYCSVASKMFGDIHEKQHDSKEDSR